jgi:protein involved in ribonucleotide reduction
MSDPLLVYFSSQSLNTERFVQKLGLRALRIPLSPASTPLYVDEDYILVCPTFAGDDGRGAVPKQVIKFLNEPRHRGFLRGVIASGNRSFGTYYGYSGTVISKKCGVPLLYKFELMGTPEDVDKVRRGVFSFWKTFDPVHVYG